MGPTGPAKRRLSAVEAAAFTLDSRATRRSWVRDGTTTCAPASASWPTMPSPIAPAPPATSTALPSSITTSHLAGWVPMSLSAPESPGSTDSAPTVTGDPATGIVPPWWSRAVFYQVYVRSFADSDGDGIGDLDGLRAHLDHLVDLGVDALWLNPIYRSPMADHGYDVADPRDIDPMFGGLAAFDRLIPALKERGIKLTMDLVPNHATDQHPWCQAALSAGPGSPERARFHFADGLGPDGSQPPNNWPSIFGGPAWTRVPDGQWYLHLFAP